MSARNVRKKFKRAVSSRNPLQEDEPMADSHLYEIHRNMKRTESSMTSWCKNISGAYPTIQATAIINLLLSYKDSMSIGEEKHVIDSAASRTASIIKTISDNQETLGNSINERFIVPTQNYIENDLEQGIKAITAFEKANETYQAALTKLSSVTKKSSNQQKQAEAQEEVNTSRKLWENHMDYSTYLTEKITAKHEFLTLEALNNIICSYKEYFDEMAGMFSTISIDIDKSITYASKKRENYENQFSEEFFSPADLEPPLSPVRSSKSFLIESSEKISHKKKKRKRSASTDKRLHVLSTLLSSELEYVNTIKYATDFKRILLRDEKLAIYTTSICNIFSNVEDIDMYYKQYRIDLIALVSNWNPTKVGEFCLNTVKSMKVFEIYSKNFRGAATSVATVKKFPTFREALEETETSLHCGPLLELLPAILSHPSTLCDAIRKLALLTKSETDPQLLDALKEIEALQERIRLNGYSFDNFHQLQEIQRKIHGKSEDLVIAEPHRQFIHEGTVSLVKRNKKKEDYHAYLFSDVIVFTSKRPSPPSILKRNVPSSYSYVAHTVLSHVTMHVDDVRKGIRLVSDSNTVSMFWDKKEQLELWSTKINDVITKLQKPKTFGVPFDTLMEACKNQKTIIPPFVKESVQNIICKGMSTESLFKAVPPFDAVENLRKALDREDSFSFDESSSLTVSWLLLRWLRELPTPLIPFSFNSKIITTDKPESVKMVVEAIPTFRRFVLEYIMGCCECIASHPKIAMSAAQLAVIFAPCLTRQRTNKFSVLHITQTTQFTLTLISHFDTVFGDVTKERIAAENDVGKISLLFTEFEEKQAKDKTKKRGRSSSLNLRKEKPSLVAANLEQKGGNKIIKIQEKPIIRGRDRANSVLPPTSASSPYMSAPSTPFMIARPSRTESPTNSPIISLRRCFACSGTIDGSKPLKLLGKLWHSECFVCKECKASFPEGKFLEKDGFPVCDACLRKSGVLCGYCHERINGAFTKALDQFWHPEHFLCSQCSCLIQNGFFEVKGHVMCRTCFEKHE